MNMRNGLPEKKPVLGGIIWGGSEINRPSRFVISDFFKLSFSRFINHIISIFKIF